MLAMLIAAAVSEPSAAVHVAAIAGLIGMVIPLISGFVTKKYADKKWATYVTALLAVVAGSVAALSQDVANGDADWVLFVVGIGTGYVSAISSYKGFHVPTGLAGAVQNVAPDFGLGRATANPLDMTSAPRTEQLGELGVAVEGGRAPEFTPQPVPRVDPPTVQSGAPRASRARKKR